MYYFRRVDVNKDRFRASYEEKNMTIDSKTLVQTNLAKCQIPTSQVLR